LAGCWHAVSFLTIVRKTNLPKIDRAIELYYQPLFRFAARLCGSPVRAMILTQATFRRAFEQSRQLPVPANLRGWLFSILFHAFLEERSRARSA